jgi:diketogulonate reductase-like aldo/keto reductase
MTKPADVPAISLPSGGRMPIVGFGTWKLRGHQAYSGCYQALKAGYRHFDTATMYGNEAEVGQALRDSGIDRSELFVTTKIRPSDVGRERAVLTSSLRLLGTDYVDLWLVHWPPRRDEASRQMWAELLRLKADGLARDVGVSNYSLGEIDDLIEDSGTAPAVNQVHWNPRRFDADVLAGHRERRIELEGYSPLKDTKLDNRVLVDIASAHDVTPAQVVLRWHIEHDITVIPKSSQPDRIRANIDLFGFSLTQQEVNRIDEMGVA